MNWRAKLVVLAVLVMGDSAAWADSKNTAIRSAEWTWPWYITLPLLAAVLLYAMGSWRMRRRNSRIHVLPIAFFAAGWLSFLLALDSPIHEISEQLFWVHMTQHEILMVISAPLLVLSQPAAPLLFALPVGWRAPIAGIARLSFIRRTCLMISSTIAACFL